MCANDYSVFLVGCVCRRAGGDSSIFSSAWYQRQAAVPVCCSVSTSTAPTSLRGIHHVSFNGELRSLSLYLLHLQFAWHDCRYYLDLCCVHFSYILLLSFSPIFVGSAYLHMAIAALSLPPKGPIHDPQWGRRATQTRHEAAFARGAVVGGGDPADDGGSDGHLCWPGKLQGSFHVSWPGSCRRAPRTSSRAHCCKPIMRMYSLMPRCNHASQWRGMFMLALLFNTPFNCYVAYPVHDLHACQ